MVRMQVDDEEDDVDDGKGDGEDDLDHSRNVTKTTARTIPGIARTTLERARIPEDSVEDNTEDGKDEGETTWRTFSLALWMLNRN